MLKISLIYASNSDNIIGINNKIPWHYSEDFQYFKNYTLNKKIIMGRKTWESLGKKPLPNRENIVISSNLAQENCAAYSNLEKVLFDFADEGYCIIGGAEIYSKSIEFLTKKGKSLEVSRTVIPDQPFLQSTDYITRFSIPEETENYTRNDSQLIEIQTSKNNTLIVVKSILQSKFGSLR